MTDKVWTSEEIRDLYLSGLTMYEVVAKTGWTINYVRKVCRPVARPARGRNAGEKHWNWKGGTIWQLGYCYVYLPGYHRPNFGAHAKRADLVLEEKLGRLLKPDEIAHHINNDRSDDRPDNLEVMNSTEHRRLTNAEHTAAGVYRNNGSSRMREKGKFSSANTL